MRIAFFGLPLAALALEHDGHELSLVCLSRLDTPGLRRARRIFGDRLLERPKADDPALQARLEAARPELLVSWFWTTRLPMRLVRACPLGSVGVHPSLLPRHRGPDPYHAAIASGDDVTGVTAHRLAAAYDTGAVLAQRTLRIDPSWNAWKLARALDRPSLALLREVVGAFSRGEAPVETPQDDALATLAPVPDDEEAELTFDRPTAEILLKIRALSPVPGAYTEIGDEIVSITEAAAAGRFPRSLLPGEAAVVEGRAVIRTADGAIELLSGEIGADLADAAALASLVERVREQERR
jgi:methionyl-tRNA formyltransferase